MIFAILEKKPLDFFEKLFELGADPNKTYLDINFGVSPLALAIEHENIGVVGILLDNDADPERPFNWIERQNMTPGFVWVRSSGGSTGRHSRRRRRRRHRSWWQQGGEARGK